MRVFSLVEEGEVSIPEADLVESAAVRIENQYGAYLSLRLEGVGALRHYSVRSRGYVGLFPLSGGRVMHVVPKVSIASVWGMLDYAYKLGRVRWLSGKVSTESVEGLASSLVQEFIELVSARLRRGLAWDYAEKEATGEPVRGRIVGPDPRGALSLRYRFAEGGTDNPINRLPLWALYRLCSMPWQSPLQQQLTRLYRALSAQVGLVPVEYEYSHRIAYGRSRADYGPVHDLSRFFLRCCTPGIGHGKELVTPFVLHMPSLYEECIAQWLVEHFGAGYQVRRQWRVEVPGSHPLSFRIDVALLNQSGMPLTVFDTKYKLDTVPSSSDVQQMAAYAVHVGVPCGFLLYPHDTMEPGISHVGQVEVHALGFDFAQGDSGRVLDYIKFHINKNM